jgi:chromosome segregation ATPase
MAQQIKKKFIGADQIDGSKILLEANQTLRKKDGVGGEIDVIQDLKSYTDQKVADLVDSAPELLDTLKELADALGGDENFATTITGQLSNLDEKIDQEIEDRQEAVDDLQSQIDDVDGYAQEIRSDLDDLDGYAQEIRSDLDQEVEDRQEADAALDARIQSLEAKGYSKGSVVVGTELAYIDLDKQYSMLLSVSVGRVMIHEDEDFTVSVVGGKTRLTWVNSLLSPTGDEAIEEGDKVFFAGVF